MLAFYTPPSFFENVGRILLLNDFNVYVYFFYVLTNVSIRQEYFKDIGFRLEYFGFTKTVFRSFV